MTKKQSKFPSFPVWLSQQNIGYTPTGDHLVALKKEHRQAYLKWYHQSYRRKTHQLKMEVRKEEIRYFKNKAEQYPQFQKQGGKVNLSRFILEAAKAYCEQEQILKNPIEFRAVEVQLKKIGGTINGLVHKLHRKGHATATEVEMLRRKVVEVEQLFYRENHSSSKNVSR